MMVMTKVTTHNDGDDDGIGKQGDNGGNRNAPKEARGNDMSNRQYGCATPMRRPDPSWSPASCTPTS